MGLELTLCLTLQFILRSMTYDQGIVISHCQDSTKFTKIEM